MKQTPKVVRNLTLWVFLCIIFTKLNVAATPLTVEITGGFTNQSWQFNNSDGSQDELTISATVDLQFYPATPTCTGTNFTSSTVTNISGSIHVWGTVTRYDPNPTITDNFDNTYNYNGGTLPVAASYEGQDGLGGVQQLSWQIATSRSQNNALPYYLNYDGLSQTLGLWVSLPSPFWYPTSDEEYDTTGSASVTGQQNVPSNFQGTVNDAASDQPLPGAYLSFGTVPQTADANGAFNYQDIPANTYQIIVTNSGYFPFTNLITIPGFIILHTNIQLTAKVPVILVHGWRGSPVVWDNLEAALTNAGIPYDAITYNGSGDPRVAAQAVAGAVDTFRQSGYSGKVDIVCHSMGALVSRWYMEYMNGGRNVRQWIGVAPVNQGAALADISAGLGPLAWLASVSIPDLSQDGAITQMQTGSPTVTTLNAAGRSPGVIYRNIVGYNGCVWPYNYNNGVCTCQLSREFSEPYAPGGKTFARIVDSAGVVHPHAWTYFGDGLVALVQSQLPGSVSSDTFENLGHNNLPTNTVVIEQIMNYLQNLNAPSLNNYPTTAELLSDAHIETTGANNQGYIYSAQQVNVQIPVDSSVQELVFSLEYDSGSLSLNLVDPSGTLVAPGVYPFVQYSNTVGSVWYIIDSPMAGNWTSRIDAINVPTNGEPYYFEASFTSPMELSLQSTNGGQPTHLGQPMEVWANFQNGTNAITNATVSANVLNPNGQMNSLTFYDDGVHGGDQIANDGIYSASFMPTNAGTYTLQVTATTGLVQRVDSLIIEVQPPTGRPVLSATAMGGMVQLNWTAPAGAFILEGTTNLLGTNWFAVPVCPNIDSNFLNTTTLNVSGQQFFRLQGPQ